MDGVSHLEGAAVILDGKEVLATHVRMYNNYVFVWRTVSIMGIFISIFDT